VENTRYARVFHSRQWSISHVRTDRILPGDDASRPIVAAHEAHVTVRPGQLERVRHLVHASVEESKQAFVAEQAALRVGIVNEDDCITGTQLAPASTVVPEVRQSLVAVMAYDVANVHSVTEFRNSSYEHVLVGMHRLTFIAHVAYLSTHYTVVAKS